MQSTIHTLLWQLQKQARNLGLWGLLGLVIALLSAFMGLPQIAKLSAENEALQAKLLQQTQLNQIASTQMQTEQAQLVQSQLAGSQLDSEQQAKQQSEASFTHFYQQLDGAQALTKHLGAIHRSATQHGIQLNRGDYKVVKLKKTGDDQPLQQYQVVLPIKAQYLQVQGLIAAVMKENPNLALADLQITRDSNLSPNVDARVVFTLFFKGEM